jgi:hypothetical protein
LGAFLFGSFQGPALKTPHPATAGLEGFSPPTNGRNRGQGWPRQAKTPARNPEAWMPRGGGRVLALLEQKSHRWGLFCYETPPPVGYFESSKHQG